MSHSTPQAVHPVRQIREALGLSYDELGKLAGVSHQTIRNIENPDYPLNYSEATMNLVAAALGKQVSELFSLSKRTTRTAIIGKRGPQDNPHIEQQMNICPACGMSLSKAEALRKECDSCDETLDIQAA